MRQMKVWTILALVFGALAMFFVSGCGSSQSSGKSVAVAFANSSPSWQKNGQAIKDMLEKEGFTATVAYADTADQQIEQIKSLIAENPACLVVGAVDGGKLSDVLAEAKKKGIPVIAYDRLILNTDAVSYFAAYDNEAVGTLMGEYIEAKLGLASGGGPYTMEIFTGDTGDNNAHLFYKGSMAVLQPYIDKGQIVIPSGETTFEQTTIEGWKPEGAEARMKRLIEGPDEGRHIDIILSPNDGLASGTRKALLAAGYAGSMPLTTGQDGEDQAFEAIKNGQQAMTTLKDPEQLVAKTIRMIKAVVDGTEPEINDVTTYDNGVMIVPSFLCTPLIVDKDNLSAVNP